MLTRTLALGNIMIISSEVRRGAYWHILETCFYDTRYNPHIEAILKGVSERIGLANSSQLFGAYASQLAYSICRMNANIPADIHQLVPTLLGYRDRLECAEATFRSFAPSMIVESPNMFENHCMVLQKSVTQGVRECFGDIIGLLIIMWVAEPGYSTDGLESYLKEHTGMNDQEFISTFHLNVDRVTVAVLKSLGDQDISQDGPIMNALRKFDSNGGSALTFKSLTRFRTAEDFQTHSPNLPAHPTHVVLRALEWIVSRSADAGDKATTYHIMHQVFADIQSSPLINEQYRLVNALTLWIALRHSDFKNDVILIHSLVHGATSLLAQSDLARVAQSWLEWAFHRYMKYGVRDKRLSNILIRIACYAYEHARSLQDASVTRTGLDILKWIDEKIQDFEGSEQSPRTDFRDQILRALPAWSHQLSPQILNMSKSIDIETLSSLLNDHQITTNKFRTVRRLRDQAIAGDCDETHFETHFFWRLKECIPPQNDLQIEDADAFAGLLYLHKGRINSFGADRAIAGSVRALHQNTAGKSLDEGSAVRDSIVYALWSMLDGDEASKVHLTYRTMRWVMSVIPTEAFSLNTWKLEVKEELKFLQMYKWISKPNSQRKLEELTHESFIDSACHFSQWVSMFTILLADVLSSTDVFYAQLTPILGTHSDFAGEVLPVLVYRLLQNDMDKDKANKNILSGYFTGVLEFKTSDISCIRAIVDVVLHLRHFNSKKTNDALAYNKWLNISYTLLAQSALKCGSYTTALLFLELAFEFKNDGAVESSEEILYEIYSHIDEPDGFYGITSQDLGRFLIKRFHHEKQWDKALRFHGAALEAGSREGNEAEGLLEAFHAFGFDHLAIDTLRGPSTLGSNVPRTSYMHYQLAWRTETWDLPERTEKTSGAALYHALRSVYRERDVKAVDRIVHSSLIDEVSRLRPLGAENLAEIRKVSRDIMCLGEIFRWRLRDIQDRLTSKRTDISNWNDFVTMPEGFK